MIRQIEVDGVRTLLVPTTGPMHAGLVFRVGRADETLARAGITHLIEHLALHPVGLTDYHFNGATGQVVTHFHMQGAAKDVAAFLSGVCDALSDLPMERMQVEKEILRTEQDSRTPHVLEPMGLWRHGARDYGVASFPEWGLSMLTEADLRAWTARYFTRDNAVLWIAGDDVPEGLSLRLPAGVPQPAPTASSALPVTPAYFSGSAKAVAFDTVVPRSVASAVFAALLERELFRALRQEGGLSYTVAANYEPCDDGWGIVTALADALPEKQDAVLGGFVDVLAKLRIGRIDQADVDAVVAKLAEGLSFADAEAASLPGQALNLLNGLPLWTVEERRAELKTITVDEVAAIARQAMDSALLMVPRGRRADWAGYAAAPTQSDHAVTGGSHPVLPNGPARLVVGAEGASRVDDGETVTVRFDQCAAMLAWPDGGRVLVGHDGISLSVEPTLYRWGSSAVAKIDAAVPAAARVDLPARDPARIPQPPPLGSGEQGTGLLSGRADDHEDRAARRAGGTVRRLQLHPRPPGDARTRRRRQGVDHCRPRRPPDRRSGLPDRAQRTSPATLDE